MLNPPPKAGGGAGVPKPPFVPFVGVPPNPLLLVDPKEFVLGAGAPKVNGVLGVDGTEGAAAPEFCPKVKENPPPPPFAAGAGVAGAAPNGAEEALLLVLPKLNGDGAGVEALLKGFEV